MNKSQIRVKFGKFLQEFATDDFKMVMQFLKQVLLDYEANQLKIFGKIDCSYKLVLFQKRSHS